MTAALPPAPPGDWHDLAAICICAPRPLWLILSESERRFLWRLDRRRRPPPSDMRDRLPRIVARLDGFAIGRGITWP